MKIWVGIITALQPQYVKDPLPRPRCMIANSLIKTLHNTVVVSLLVG